MTQFFDTTNDGVADAVIFDSNSDGYEDVLAYDLYQNNDGAMETFAADTNGDEVVDTLAFGDQDDATAPFANTPGGSVAIVGPETITEPFTVVELGTPLDPMGTYVGPVTNPDPMVTLLLELAEHSGNVA